MLITSRHWGHAAATWCTVFALLHLYWALGGSLGLAVSAGPTLAANRPTWFVLAGLWGVAALLLLGAVFTLALSHWRPRGYLRRAATLLGYLIGGLLLLRGVLIELALATNLGGVATETGPAQTRWSLYLWNPWFILGGALILLATRHFTRFAANRDPTGQLCDHPG
ncbi:DUF3995 domain-containing protein [Actinokineospora enzanensis]|uniref:DUF3995 domain-containing protein n=1 Tax=Actinokineospora enzanensis TaxID=155975 RepID=UPI000377C479|nr:DUF3995 domain-containing protein [Actinokineospora enzanensis]